MVICSPGLLDGEKRDPISKQMEKKKILLFSNWYEPGYKGGGPIQSCRNIVETFRDKFDFYVFTADRDLGENIPYSGIVADQWSKSSEGVKIWYASPSFLGRQNIRRLITDLHPDLVYFNSMFSPKYTLLPLWILIKTNFSGKTVLAPRGMLHPGAMQQKNIKKNVFLKLFKLMGLYRKIVFHATGEQERKDIASNISKNAKVIIAENIPNLDGRPWIERSKTIHHLNCVFISRVETKKNLHYFLELLSRTDSTDRINFDIYGEEEDGNYARRCKEIANTLGPHIQIRFLGPLPHREIFDTLRRYQLFILPTLGENFGHAIFEALSTGCPVLISDQTPWLNLASQKLGWDIPLNDPDKFLDALNQAIYFDQSEFNVWSRNAYQYAIDFFNRLDIKTEYLKLFS